MRREDSDNWEWIDFVDGKFVCYAKNRTHIAEHADFIRQFKVDKAWDDEHKSSENKKYWTETAWIMANLLS